MTSVKDNDPIAVPNCLQAMRYSDNSHVFEFTPYRGLDQSIGVVVDSGSGYKVVIRRSGDPEDGDRTFIQNEYLAFATDRPSQG